MKIVKIVAKTAVYGFAIIGVSGTAMVGYVIRQAYKTPEFKRSRAQQSIVDESTEIKEMFK